MLTAVHVQQHAGKRTSGPSPPMRAPLLASPDETGTLESLLDPGVAELDAMLIPQLLVKVPHAQVEVGFLRERQHTLDLLQRHTQGGALPGPLIPQPVLAEPLVALAPAPHGPITDTDDLGGLQPGDSLGHGLQNHGL